MSISTLEFSTPVAHGVSITADTLNVDLSDGRSVSVPISWFPRLAHARESERRNWRLVGNGEGIRWEEIDEDISVESLLAGRRSSESQKSLAAWLKARGQK
jgi:uncharacterized protein DUF2442